MRTIRTKVYKFNELNEKAKQKAIDNNRNESDFWNGENEKSLREFCNIFPAKINRRGDGLNYTGDVELSGQRLATYIWNNYRKKIYAKKYYSICDGRPNVVGANSKHRYSNIQLDELNCVLTGFYIDNELLAPIFDFMRKPTKSTDFETLIDECYAAFECACKKDYEYQQSDEATIENIEANEMEFFADGSNYHAK